MILYPNLLCDKTQEIGLCDKIGGGPQILVCVMPDVNQNSKDLTLVMQKRLWNSFQFNFWKSNFEHYILYLEALEIVLNTIYSL